MYILPYNLLGFERGRGARLNVEYMYKYMHASTTVCGSCSLFYAVCMHAVLATIEGEIENVTISRGESTKFTCKFSKGDVDIAINWSVDDIVFDECGSTEKDISPDCNGCYTTGTESVLFLGNTSSFSTGNHQVQCVIQQNITDNFQKDPSFKEIFNNMTSKATLEISPPSKCLKGSF